METALRRIADMLGAFVDAVAAWIATGAWRPETWPGITWVLFAALVVLSWLLAWRRRAPRSLDVRPPQLLVTSGEVVPDGTDEPAYRPSGRRRRHPTPEAHALAGTYAMTVSNLSRYPVQLLEIALRDGRRGAPRVATVDAIVPAMGSVSVSGRIALGLRGDGWLDLYCYAAAPRVKMHRHRVELVWEPWAARFKAAPLEQVSAPVRQLASDERDARFLEDDEPDALEPVAVAPVQVRPAERREAAPRAPAPSATSDDERATPWVAPSVRAAVAAEPVAPEPVAPEPVAAEPVAPEPTAPASSAPEPVAPPAAAGAPRSKPAQPTPRSPARPASADAGTRGGVPRIATPPVGVAVTGRGGASARTADGLPIGRPNARAERVPTAAGEPPRDAVAAAVPERAPEQAPEPVRRPPRPASPEAPAAREGRDAPAAREAPTARPERIARPTPIEPPTSAASEDEPQPDPPVRRRPRLEFPDEF